MTDNMPEILFVRHKPGYFEDSEIFEAEKTVFDDDPRFIEYTRSDLVQCDKNVMGFSQQEIDQAHGDVAEVAYWDFAARRGGESKHSFKIGI